MAKFLMVESSDCPSASEATQKKIGKYNIRISQTSDIC